MSVELSSIFFFFEMNWANLSLIIELKVMFKIDALLNELTRICSRKIQVESHSSQIRIESGCPLIVHTYFLIRATFSYIIYNFQSYIEINSNIYHIMIYSYLTLVHSSISFYFYNFNIIIYISIISKSPIFP